jgi:probable HAF family extracellular repeat protein
MLPVVAAAQTTFHATALPVFPGTTSCTPNAVNDSGVVVGNCGNAAFDYTAVVWRGGAVTSLGKFPKGHYSSATAINSLGKVVGDADAGDFQPKPFVTTGSGLLNVDLQGGSNILAIGVTDTGIIFGNFTSSGGGNPSSFTPVYWVEDSAHPGRYKRTSLPKLLTTDKSSGAQAAASNKAGQVAGNVYTATLGQHGAFWNNDATHSVITLDTLPGANQSEAFAINDIGQAAGESNTFRGPRATLWDNDAAHTPVDMGTLPGDDQSQASGLNAAGQVVGISALGSLSRGFLYQNGVMMDLASLIDPADGFWTIDQVAGINNAGQIIAVGSSGGQSTAILLTPVVQ